MEQFGVYLIPLNQVTYQMSLCPTHYNNIAICDYCKQSMANNKATKSRGHTNGIHVKQEHCQPICRACQWINSSLPHVRTCASSLTNRCCDITTKITCVWWRYPFIRSKIWFMVEIWDVCQLTILSMWTSKWLHQRTQLNLYSSSELYSSPVRWVESIRYKSSRSFKINFISNTIKHYMMEETGTTLPQISHMRDVNLLNDSQWNCKQ